MLVLVLIISQMQTGTYKENSMLVLVFIILSQMQAGHVEGKFNARPSINNILDASRTQRRKIRCSSQYYHYPRCKQNTDQEGLISVLVLIILSQIQAGHGRFNDCPSINILDASKTRRSTEKEGFNGRPSSNILDASRKRRKKIQYSSQY